MKILNIKVLVPLFIFGILLVLTTTQSLGNADKRPTHVPRQVLVKFKKQTTDATVHSVTSTFSQKHGLKVLHTFTPPKTLSSLAVNSEGVLQLLEHPSRSCEDLITSIKNEPEIEWVEPNYYRYLYSSPDDPHFDKLWALKNLGQKIDGRDGTVGYDISHTKAELFSRQENSDFVIAVADTGVDVHHPDLTNQLWRNPREIPDNNIDDDGNNYVDDIYGYHFAMDSANVADSGSHGTHVTGTIAAERNNAIGISGVFPKAKIITLGISNDGLTIDSASTLKAYDYIIGLKNANVKIVAVNASYGGYTYSIAENEAMVKLKNAGIIVCAAAGNDSNNLDNYKTYPACYDHDNIISVAGNDSNHKPYVRTNFGKTQVDLSAPGTSVYSTIPLELISPKCYITIESTTYSAKSIQYSKNTSNSGISGKLYNCKLGKTGEFPTEVQGHIALIQRGETTFDSKVENATAAGAVGVIIYNNIDNEDGNWVLDKSKTYRIPSIRISKADGALLLNELEKNATMYSIVRIEDAYAFKSGTSMATPHVSAAVAYAAHNYPDESHTERIARILNNVAPVADFKDLVATGGILNLKNIVDTDRDEMPDWWERLHFSNLEKSSSSDTDGDGFFDHQEFLSATNPTMARSTVQFEQSEIHPNTTSSFKFKTASGRYYQVQRSDGSLHPSGWYNVGELIKGDNNIKTINDEPTTNQRPNRFYRLKISTQ
jgi:subtilisin family serine protease